MNQHFNLGRFGRLLRQQVQAHLGSYALQIAVLLGIMLLVIGGLSYLQHEPPPPSGQQIFLLLFLLGAGGYFASVVLAEYGQGSRAALALLLPASQLEKFLVAWLLSGPLFLVVFLADFYLADWLIVSTSPRAELLNVFAERSTWLDLLQAWTLVHAIWLWGSIYFRKQQFVRTAFVLFGAGVLVSVANFRALKALVTTKVAFALPFGTPHLVDNNSSLSLSLPDAQTAWLTWLPLALVLLLWATAYVRLTEKQL